MGKLSSRPAGVPADDIRGGRPERYYEYLYKTYGNAFRLGSVEGLETFRELYRQIFLLGNERSTILFIEKFVPLLPASARREILREFLAERNAMQRRSAEENAKIQETLFMAKKRAD
jgi:hypothetical protein